MLDARKAAILAAIVEEYVATGEPVGSATVTKKRRLGISPATVRNEMAALEQDGYIEQPHTSAGRVPTDLGYRHYVDVLPRRRRLPASHRRAIDRFFSAPHSEFEQLLAETSRLLSDLTKQAAAVVGLSPIDRCVRAVHLDPLDGRILMATIVTDDGRVVSRRIELDVQAAGSDVDDALETLRRDLVGKPARSGLSRLAGEGGAKHRSVEPKRERAGATDRGLEIARGVAGAFGTELWESTPSYYLGGASKAAAVGAFDDLETLHALLELFEKGTELVSLFEIAMDSGTMTVIIGRENPLRELRECAFVAANFESGAEVAGSVGVVGPMRMDYGTVIGGVTEVSRRLSETVAGLG